MHRLAREVLNPGAHREPRHLKPTLLEEEALAVRGNIAHGLDQLRVHHAKDLAGLGLDHGVFPPVVMDGAKGVVEGAHVVSRDDALVRDSQALDGVHHVNPAVKRAGHRLVRSVVERGARKVAAVVVVGLVQVDDGLCLAERLHQEGVVRPAGTGERNEPDAVLAQEVRAVDGRPDGRVQLHEHGVLRNGERGRRGLHAPAHVALPGVLG